MQKAVGSRQAGTAGGNDERNYYGVLLTAFCLLLSAFGVIGVIGG